MFDHGWSSTTLFGSGRGRHRFRRVCAVAVAAVSVLVTFATPAHGGERRRVLVVGDSVTVGATPAIESMAAQHEWSVAIDAEVGRPTADGVAILAALRGRLPDVVVVELGTNDGEHQAGFADRVDEAMRALAGVDHVVWYTITPFASWVPAANEVLQAATQRWPTLVLADWATVSETTPGALAGRGPHLQDAGAQAFAHLFYGTIDQFPEPAPVVVPDRARLRAQGRVFPRAFSRLDKPSPLPALDSTNALNATTWEKEHPPAVAEAEPLAPVGPARTGSTRAARLTRPIIGVWRGVV